MLGTQRVSLAIIKGLVAPSQRGTGVIVVALIVVVGVGVVVVVGTTVVVVMRE